MVNLIWRDLIVHKNMLVIMLLALTAYMYLTESVIFMGVVFTLSIVLHMVGTDEKKPIQMLWTSLPYTRAEMVVARYISSLFFIVGVMALISIYNYIFNGVTPEWRAYLVSAGLSLFTLSFFLPFTYKFKTKFLMTGSIVLFVVYMFVVNFFIKDLNDKIRGLAAKAMEIDQWLIALSAGGILILIYLLSLLLSIRIFKKEVI